MSVFTPPLLSLPTLSPSYTHTYVKYGTEQSLCVEDIHSHVGWKPKVRILSTFDSFICTRPIICTRPDAILCTRPLRYLRVLYGIMNLELTRTFPWPILTGHPVMLTSTYWSYVDQYWLVIYWPVLTGHMLSSTDWSYVDQYWLVMCWPALTRHVSY